MLFQRLISSRTICCLRCGRFAPDLTPAPASGIGKRPRAYKVKFVPRLTVLSSTEPPDAAVGERRNVSPTETTDPAKTETNKKDIKREISVEIPAAEVTRETELQIQRYQKSARLPGFRAGHVPASIIRQRFGDGLKNDVIEALAPRHFRKEAEKQGLIPVSQPRITDLHFHDGEPLRFKASFEILPEIQVEGYKDLRADKPEIAVTDEEVEQALSNLQEQRATYTDMEGRTLAPGDFAQASMDGRPKDGKDVKEAGANPVHMDDVL